MKYALLCPPKLKEWSADSGQVTEQSALDILLALLHFGYELGRLSEFGESLPEMVVTLPSAAYQSLALAAKHSQYKSCEEGLHPESGLPYFIFDYSKVSSYGPAFKLCVQQGCESGIMEIKN
jgi:hypothetical protein